jgi:hypothetical protein
MGDPPRPRQPIRRFDVFAEYNKLKRLHEGRPLDEAKGYGLWLAKVVAARRFRPAGEARAPGPERAREERPAGEEPVRFRSLDGEPQTDELFDREIVSRMGLEFYREVFAPAIARAFDEGQRYEAIRDAIRKDWK